MIAASGRVDSPLRPVFEAYDHFFFRLVDGTCDAFRGEGLKPPTAIVNANSYLPFLIGGLPI